MADIPSDLSSDWDRVFATLSEIHASRSGFHEFVLDAMNGIERVGEELAAQEGPSDPTGADPQVENISAVVAELTSLLTEHVRMANRERVDWAKAMRRLQSQVLPQKPPRTRTNY